MNKIIKVFSTLLVGFGLLSVSSSALAEEPSNIRTSLMTEHEPRPQKDLISEVSSGNIPFSLRVEPGVAIPTTDPQAQRFGVGGALALKPEFGIGSYVGIGPMIQAIYLPSNVPGIDPGNAWSFGPFVRVKRPHDEKNTGHGFSAISPWIDGDLKLVHTDPLLRPGVAVAAGASVPTSDSRWLWVGPFARYDLVMQEDGKLNTNTNSAKTIIVGLSFEIGAPKKVASVITPPIPAPPKFKPTVKTPELPPPSTGSVTVAFQPKIQFAWDSAKLEANQLPALRDVAKSMLADKSYKVRIEGHASSEGQVEHNEKLAQQRANSVLEFLVSNGVTRDRLTAVGFGARKPIANNKTEIGRVANRRVEFDVSFVVVKETK